MSQVPTRQRLVKIEADLGKDVSPRWRYGSGLICGERIVLTAAHVVHGAVMVTVRGSDQRARLPTALGTALIGDPDRLDLALLEVPGLTAPVPPVPVAVVNRDSTTGEFVDGCWAVGYPAFQEIRRDAQNRSIRISAHVRGQIPPLSGLGDELGLLSFQVTATPRELPARGTLEQSAWSGMSGAAVFAADMLIGVVTEHAPRRGASDITLTPLDCLSNQNTAPPNAARWWEWLGVHDPATLPQLPAAAGSREEPAYRATLRVIRGRTNVLLGRTNVLLGREDELSRIEEFATGSNDAFGPATGSDGYVWLIGGAWAGKTALLAEAVSTMPASVDAVAYFLIARESQASRDQFLAAMVPQLAFLLDIDTPQPMDMHVFRDLWARAAQRAENRSRHLLLVVDGLDEDLRPGRLSVAALLPTEDLGRHARVLSASRPYPELPDDVEVNHPLRTAATVPLAHSPHAAGLKILAQQEINALLPLEPGGAPGDDLPFQLLGILTAAAGALSVTDLATITGVKAPIVRGFITHRAARSLEPVGPVEDRRYQFAHQTLLEYCQQHPDVGGDQQYQEQLHRWAKRWQDADWPTRGDGGKGTPLYLLDTYPATLAQDSQQLAQLATDIGWVEAAIAAVGVDRVLTDLRRAAAANPASTAVAAVMAAVTRPGPELAASAAPGPAWLYLAAAVDASSRACRG